MSPQELRPASLAAWSAAVAVLYFASGELGLLLAEVGSNITLVWPPTGIAVAALFLLDRRLAAAVAVAAFSLNLLRGASAPVALAIGVGNTLGPLLVVALLRRAGVRRTFEHRRDVGAFALSTMLGMTVSSTFGVTALALGDALPPEGAAEAWALWWLGDTVGALLVAPLALELIAVRALPARRLGELALVVAVTAGIGALVFFVPAAGRLSFLAWAPIVWAALRFPRSGAMLATTVAAGFAVSSTATGRGAFVSVEPLAGLLMLSAFLGTSALGTLFVGALLAEREQAELRARREEARLSAILDAAHEAILATDAAGEIVVFNRAAEATFGILEADARGTTAERFVGRDVTAAPSGHHAEIAARRASGEPFPADVRVTRVRAGEADLCTLSIRDLSAERRAAEREQALEEQLRQTDKLRALGTLASGVAHDFNNVLTGIRLGLELMRAETKAPDLLDDMLAATTRASDVVRDLLTFARPTTARRRRVRVSRILGEVQKLLRASLPARVELSVVEPTSEALVDADPSQLHQVLLNLTTNAREALGERGGHVWLRCTDRDVDEALA